MMKKFIRILLCAIVLTIVAVAFTGCSSKKTGDNLKYKIENNEAIITGYTDTTDRKEIVVPDELDGYPVTVIADFGLFNAESLEKITIGKNVREIGEWSMTNNQHLKEFVVDEANEYFTAVDGVLFSKDMKTIIYYPNAKGVEFDEKYGDPKNRDPEKEGFNEISYVIPDGVETIRTKAFYKCYYIDNITIPDSVTRIEEKAFHHCEALKAIELPSKLEVIGKDAFAYCRKIESITIPGTIKQIGEYAFFFCESMKVVNIGAKEADVELGKNWYPTSNGKKLDVEYNWGE